VKKYGKSEAKVHRSRITPAQALGKWGENLAVEYLSQKGYTILERNARTPYGEIDLVTLKEIDLKKPSNEPFAIGSKVTVFVEVKTRSSESFGFPEESITPRKKAHLLSAAQAYLQSHPELEGDWRVDVIAVQRSFAGEEPNIIHFENAVT
jgi:putative endonuclease